MAKQSVMSGGLKSISRSRIEDFVKCPRCSYLQLRYGINPPPSLPFTLNNAADHLLKREFDVYRDTGTPHPWMTLAGIDAIPLRHPSLGSWRSNRLGVRRRFDPADLEVHGAVDDLWQARDGSVFVVDYKVTGGKPKDAMDQEWQDAYRRQAEVYQWLLRGNGLQISETAYFVYCFADKEVEGFGSQLRFTHRIFEHRGDVSWIEETLNCIRSTVECPSPPLASPACALCEYRHSVAAVLVPSKEGEQ
jgi:hypothetical protein